MVDSQMIKDREDLDLVQEAQSPENFWTLHPDSLPDIVLIDLNGLDKIPGWLEPFANQLSQSEIIVCSQCLDSEFLLRLLELHLQFIPLPLSKDNLEVTIMRVRQKRQDDKSGKITSCLVALGGSREGVGITSIATNLAIALAELTSEKVVLVDLARPFPGVGQFLNIKESHNIIDLVQGGDHLDPLFVEKILQKYRPNLSILLGNSELSFDICPFLTSSALKKIIKTLRVSFKWIVVDLGYWIDSSYRGLIEEADVMLLLTELSVPDVYNLGRIKDIFSRYNFDVSKVKIVINRYEKNNVLTLEDIERNFMQPVFYKLPNDYDSMANAMNQGEPLDQVAPKSKLWRSIKQLAMELIRQAKPASLNGTSSKPGLFRRIFSSEG